METGAFLIDRYVPAPDFCERHAMGVRAAPTTVLAQARAYRTESDGFFRAMIALRELPGRLTSEVVRKPFGIDGFTVLAEGDDEIVFGLAGRFWRSDFDLRVMAGGDDFLALAEPGIAKLALNFTVAPDGDGATRLTTETRIHCVDRAARRSFAPYWYLIRPVSGLIRRRILLGIRRASEGLAVSPLT